MKRLFATFTALLCVVLTEAQNRVELSKFKHDFGEIEEMGGDVSCKFVVKNISSEPFVIAHVRTSCSCVTSHYSRKPIAPQGVDTILIQFDPRFRAGLLNKNISVYITDKSQPINLTISGNVIGRRANNSER